MSGALCRFDNSAAHMGQIGPLVKVGKDTVEPLRLYHGQQQVPVITGAGSSPIHHLTGHGAPKPRETRTRWCGNTPTGGLVPVRWGSCKGMTELRLGTSDLESLRSGLAVAK